jgi:hypothetical protein
LVDTDARRGEQHAHADGVQVDFASRVLQLTNARGVADPMVICRAIGPKVSKVMEPYRFDRPVKGRVEGVIDLRKGTEENTRLRFDVEGSGFHWSRFNLDSVTGRVDWVDRHLQLTNVAARGYGGDVAGNAHFIFLEQGDNDSAEFGFFTAVTNVNFKLLMDDLATKPHTLEGILTGELRVHRANSDDLWSWNGRGVADLRDGLIWDIPIFGIFSPILNSIIPGLGSSRASEASAAFIITNSVVISDNLEIRSPLMRMQYRGTVGFSGNVDARVEAELLRDAWIVGRLVSFALSPLTKLFEFKVTGTLSEPRSEPLYFLPRLILMPLSPIRSIREILTEPESTLPPAPTPQLDRPSDP